MTIRLFTLGGLRGSLDGVELDRLAAQELSAALLVYLAIERAATRDAIMALLWPDQDVETAGHRLSQLLYSLRRSHGEDCLDGRAKEVRAGALESDAGDFERAVDEGRNEDAVPLYGGPFLDAVHLVGTTGFENWVDTRRARYARHFRAACRALVESRRAAGDDAGALAAARAWVEPDPLDDEAQHQLIDLLGRMGERSEALKQFASYEELLKADDLEPLDETKALVRRIRESGSPPPVEAPPPSTGMDLDAQLGSGLPTDLEVLRRLGDGTTAAVYLARDTALHRLVAVKILKPWLSSDEVALSRFEREARSAARIIHGNVAQIYRLGTLGRLPYIVMEYIDGRSLADILKARGVLPEAEARGVVRAVAAALAAAHERGIVHRDVGPGNILVENRTGRSVLTDFGLAALLESGSELMDQLTPVGLRLGDMHYMSPERIRGEPATDLGDVYSLGVVAWEMLTGEHPFRFASPDQLIVAQMNQEPRPIASVLPGIAPDLAAVIDRCLVKVAGHRPRASDIGTMLTAPG